MDEERSLDEALDELDKWGDQVVQAIESLTPEEIVEYFKQAQSRLEQETGKQLNLRVRRAPHRTPVEQ
jgi:hypothetical protein